MPEPPSGTATRPTADRRLLRTAFAAFATGVTVVTVGGTQPHGMTANSFTSVSLDPPLVLVCVDREAMMHERLAHAGGFGVSVLAAHQDAVARHFADRSRPRGSAEFEGVPCSPAPHSDAPLIDGAILWLECGLWRAYDAGDHSIFLGQVRALCRHDQEAALLFFDGRYDHLPADRTRSPFWRVL
ncbi:flavin reductase family protein [Phytohabitans suffuscus]|uniref:Oxidoreductase n=1 Tax=Phytohabitans suffuscus TaxID=624315 RepID=A0A6F8YR05_9ACTN|nr:flavin reductase family protein [Phytohabitans suffuscus]BCB88489.1 oxidoreductase [Phytohabitans suffuscus]